MSMFVAMKNAPVRFVRDYHLDDKSILQDWQTLRDVRDVVQD